MSDNNNDWKDIINSGPEPDNIPELQGMESYSKMTDEELDAYLRTLDDPDGTSAVDNELGDTMISDWLPVYEDTRTKDEINEQATNVIPDDVKKIYNTRKKPKIRDESPAQEDTEYDDYSGRDYMPVRRRRNHRTGCMGGIMYFAFVLGISIILACLLWLGANDVLSLTKQDISAVIEVPENWNLDDLVDQLKENGIIEYKFLFKLFLNYSNAESKIEPGTYELNAQLDYRAIVAKMQSGSDVSLTVDVTIPEGRTMSETFEILETKGVCSAEDLWEAAANYDFDYEFLQDSTLGDEMRLEGYLFPDTYQFYSHSNPTTVLNKFLSNFSSRVSDTMYRQAANMGLTFNEILTVASLIEMEAANNAERATVASVIYNRLNNWDYPILQIDATIQYVLPERKEHLSVTDLAIDSPYNTYLNPGLPPGPITNPGIASIIAALEPEDTPYYYYALSKEGGHRFFETYDEHEEFTDSDEFDG